MAIFSQGANPAARSTPWDQALDPIAQALGTHLQQNRAQQQNIQQGSFLQNVIREIAQKGDEANMNDVLQSIAKQQQAGYNPQQGPNVPELYRGQFQERERGRERSAFEESKREERRQKESAKAEEKLEPYRRGLETISIMRGILDKKVLGPKLGGLGQEPRLKESLSKEGQRLRGEYARLGKSLISLSSDIPIRNRAEFEEYAHGLTDPSINEEEIRGTLDALEEFFRGRAGIEESPREAYQTEALNEAGIPGNPEVLGRSQSVKPFRARNRKTGEIHENIPGELRAEAQQDPEYEILDSENNLSPDRDEWDESEVGRRNRERYQETQRKQ